MDYSLIGSSVHGIFRQGYWLPFPPPWDLPDPGIKPMYLMSPALADRFFTTTPPGKSHIVRTMQKKKAENKADFCMIQLRDRNSVTNAKTYINRYFSVESLTVTNYMDIYHILWYI